MALTTCPDCGKQVSSAANACPNCGRPTVSSVKEPLPTKDPLRAAAYNFVLPGAGYFYVGRAGLGVAMLLMYFGPLYLVLFEGAITLVGWCALMVIVGAIDGALSARKWNDLQAARAKVRELERLAR